jgi:CMP-2-keto-3-deoxyoctulosonic acid synthetase
LFKRLITHARKGLLEVFFFVPPFAFAIASARGKAPATNSNDPYLWNPNEVKIARDLGGWALYSSRAAIPHEEPNRRVPKIDGGRRLWYKHVGVNIYRRSFLLHYPTLERSPLEEAEGLEQLRIPEHGT